MQAHGERLSALPAAAGVSPRTGAATSPVRRLLLCRGVVQGVGFRPTVCRLAIAHHLDGRVWNDADGATIDVQGAASDVAAFVADLPTRLPVRAALRTCDVRDVPSDDRAPGFFVAATTGVRRGEALVPPDAALCPACRAELDDPSDRRHRHPFQSCTDCGPRFTMVRALPYDRERTSMAAFPLCDRCAVEFADPTSRRFRAESICCPGCGPRVRLVAVDGSGDLDGGAALAEARRLLAQGAIVAVKGLGGFQLVCRADDEAVVARLRRRKGRPRKPLALLVRDVATAERCVRLSPADLAALGGPEGPIVLAERQATAPVARAVAPDRDELGVMLPTTGLHHELFRDAPYDVLVATSGNRSDEPIQVDDASAVHELGEVADALLGHDRAIVSRADDSVVRACAPAPVMLRRSRGFVPAPLALPSGVHAAEPVLAFGGHLQTTLCLAHGDQAFLSPHVGDLDHEATRAFHDEVGRGLEQFVARRAQVLVADTHPDYPSRWRAEALARQRGARLVSVPHHLAHAAAVLGEHGRFPRPGERAFALVLDGTGHGPDGASWGAELLQLSGELRWSRLGHGEALDLPGGEAAVHEPVRVAVAALVAAGRERDFAGLPLAALVPAPRLAVLVQLARAGRWPLAHGAGRLFEAAAALCGLLVCNDHEGEGAALLEVAASSLAADEAERTRPWPEVLALAQGVVVPHRALLLATATRLLAGESVPRVAFGLHRTLVACWLAVVARVVPAGAPLAAGGGCLVNRLLRAELQRGLAAAGRVFLPATDVPPGDGGLAYGQTIVATAALQRSTEPTFSSTPT